MRPTSMVRTGGRHAEIATIMELGTPNRADHGLESMIGAKGMGFRVGEGAGPAATG